MALKWAARLLIPLLAAAVVASANGELELRPLQVGGHLCMESSSTWYGFSEHAARLISSSKGSDQKEGSAIHSVPEYSDGRGFFQESYAISDNGKMVGMLRQRRSASGGLDPLLLGLGRRGAPGLLLPSSFWFEDDWFRMDPFEEMWRRHVSTFSQALEEHLQLTLPWLPERQTLGARQPLLARVLAAGAAPGDAGVGGADGGGPKPRMPMWVDAGPPWLPGHGTDEAEWDWHLLNEQGGLNWGLVAFVALASACVAVWGGIASQYLRYLRNKAQVGARRPRAFATALVPNPSSPDVLMPLLAESPRPASRGRRGSSMKCAHESPKAELLE